MEKTLETIHALYKQNIRDIRRTGSAALDMCWVACGRFDGYFEYRLFPWDSARQCSCPGGRRVCVDKTGRPLGVTPENVVTSNAAISREF